jgi:DNA-binding IclR family transcriptional regulator
MGKQRRAVGVLKKALDILSFFRLQPEGMTLAEISHLTKITKSTAHRLLLQLEAEGFLQRSEKGRYRIGQSLFQLGLLAAHPLELREAAHSDMSILVHEIGETVNLAILDHTTILILNVIESVHEFRMAAKVGSRRPFYLTALGKSIAAFLVEEKQKSLMQNLPMPLETPTPNSIRDLPKLREELGLIRARGFALDNEEAVVGVRAVAAPIFKGSGEVQGAISVSGPVSRISNERIPRIASTIMRAADSVTLRLGADPQVSRLTAQQHNRELISTESAGKPALVP